MRKIIFVIHTSFDGYVSNLNGKLVDFIGDDELLNFSNELTKDADTALFGRINFGGMENYWLTAGDLPNATFEEIRFSNWYKNATRICISRTTNKVPDDIITLKKQNGKNILLYGSITLAHSLFEHNLIDEIWWLVHPRIFGKGTPLFKEEHRKINLSRKGVKLFPNGVTAIYYAVEK